MIQRWESSYVWLPSTMSFPWGLPQKTPYVLSPRAGGSRNGPWPRAQMWLHQAALPLARERSNFSCPLSWLGRGLPKENVGDGTVLRPRNVPSHTPRAHPLQCSAVPSTAGHVAISTGDFTLGPEGGISRKPGVGIPAPGRDIPPRGRNFPPVGRTPGRAFPPPGGISRPKGGNSGPGGKFSAPGDDIPASGPDPHLLGREFPLSGPVGSSQAQLPV